MVHNYEPLVEKWPLKPATSGTPWVTPRGEGLCSKCGVNPKYAAPGGTKYSWCLPCRKARMAERVKQQREAATMVSVETPPAPVETPRLCASCGVNPRAVDYKGHVQSNCIACRRARKNKWYHDRQSAAAREQRITTVGEQAPTPSTPTARHHTVDAASSDTAADIADIVTGMILLASRVRPVIQGHTDTALRMSLESGGVALKIGVERIEGK